MSEWTPGPWESDREGLRVTGEDGAMPICDVRGWGRLTGSGIGGRSLDPLEASAIQQANARLISAAPELYEALEAALQAGAMLASLQDNPVEEWIAVAKAGRAALAKAAVRAGAGEGRDGEYHVR